MKFLFLSLILVFNVYAESSSSSSDRKAEREKRRAERKKAREAAKLTYGIDKSNPDKWKCKKGQGQANQSKSDCKSALRTECDGKPGFKFSGSSCKKQKLFKIESKGDGWKCVKSSDGTLTKEKCKTDLGIECSQKGDGYKMSGKSCKKQKLFKVEQKGDGLKCVKSTEGTLTKEKCKTQLETECTKKGEGFKFSGKSCKKQKLFKIEQKGDGHKCVKASDGTLSKDNCIKALTTKCESPELKDKGFKIVGKKCTAKKGLFKAGAIGAGLSTVGGKIKDLAIDNKDAAVDFVKKKRNEKKLADCKKKLADLQTIKIELLKPKTEEDDEDLTSFKNMDLSKKSNQINPIVTTDMVADYKENATEVSASEILAQLPPECANGKCKAKVVAFVTGQAGNSCESVENAQE